MMDERMIEARITAAMIRLGFDPPKDGESMLKAMDKVASALEDLAKTREVQEGRLQMEKQARGEA